MDTKDNSNSNTNPVTLSNYQDRRNNKKKLVFSNLKKNIDRSPKETIFNKKHSNFKSQDKKEEITKQHSKKLITETNYKKPISKKKDNIKKTNYSTKKEDSIQKKKQQNTKTPSSKNKDYETPTRKNMEDDVVTSFERKPSELKSPDTVSEDSFLSIEEDNNNNNNDSKEKNGNSELIYLEKITNNDDYNESEKLLYDNKKSESNIKVNMNSKISKNNNNNSTIKDKGIVSKEINKRKNAMSKNKDTKSNDNENAYVPVNQRKLTVNKKIVQIPAIIETKYNRNTNKLIPNSNLDVIDVNKNKTSDLNFSADKKVMQSFKHKISNIKKEIKNEIFPKNIMHFSSEEENGTEQREKLNRKQENIIFSKKLRVNGDDNKIKNNYNNRYNTNNNISGSAILTKNNSSNKIDKIDKNSNGDNKNNQMKNVSIKFESKKSTQSVSDVYYQKKSNVINKTKTSTNKLNNKVVTANNDINNFQKVHANGNNIVYAPKKAGGARVRSHEKKFGRVIHNNSISKNMIMKSLQSEVNFNVTQREQNEISFPRKNSEVGFSRFLEKNNSFCVANEEHPNILGRDSLRLDFLNGINSNNCNLNYANLKNNMRMGMNDNNYYNKTAQKIDNQQFITALNNIEKINFNQIPQNNLNNNQNCNRSVNLSTNVNTETNSLNNFVPNNLFSSINQYPSTPIYPPGMMSPFNNIPNKANIYNLINNNSNFYGIINQNIPNRYPGSFITSYNFADNLLLNRTMTSSINIEDVIILQGKLKEVLSALNKTKTMANECFEFWNFYYNSSIYCQLEKLFKNQLESNSVRICINYMLLSIMICYDYSYEFDVLNSCYTILIEVIKLNYKNLMIIYEYILCKITKDSKNNLWVLKLKNIISLFKNSEKNDYNMSTVESINYNTNIIIQNLRSLLKNYKTHNNECLTSIFKKIKEQSYEQINNFFREKIFRINNINGSILGSVYLRNNSNFSTVPAPYVRTKNNKEFSLILDLDETLVHFKEKMNGEGGGILRIRPGVTEFLEEVGKYYELILFTTATQEYADILIDSIEEDKIYFDHRLYREHAIIYDNDFVKDLTRIGRPIEKMIIVDNMPQNFRLQKENGIIIKAFWGEDNYDTALLDLIPILVNIAKEGGDLRKGIVKYKDEILNNVTSFISKENI